MTEEEKFVAQAYKEKKEKQIQDIFGKYPESIDALRAVYNQAVKDCLASARHICIADHMSSGFMARNFSVDKKSIEQNIIPDKLS